MVIAITVSFLLGGSNRVDVAPLIVLRPLLIICLAVLTFLVTRRDWTGLKWPLLLLGMLGAVIAAQLLPLPPAIWSRIPGHAPFLEADVLTGNAPWRPLNLTPDRGWVSLLSLGGPLVAVVGLAGCERRHWPMLVGTLVAVVLTTAAAGIIQIVAGAKGPADFYPGSHFNEAVGLFANRNHQALFLAMGFPLLRCWVLAEGRRRMAAGIWIPVLAGLAALMLVPVILLTGSRSGLVMVFVGLLGAAWMGLPITSWVGWFVREPHGKFFRVGLLAAIVGMPIALLGAAILVGRAVAVQRLLSLSFQADRRAETLPVVIKLVRAHWVSGSGFGSFDPLFRVYEPASILRQTFFNHAHNDLLELLITGGVPAIIVLLAFLVWLGRSFLAVQRRQTSPGDLPYARLGITLVVMALLASLSDYPLRTPAMALVFGLAVAWAGKTTGASGGHGAQSR